MLLTIAFFLCNQRKTSKKSEDLELLIGVVIKLSTFSGEKFLGYCFLMIFAKHGLIEDRR